VQAYQGIVLSVCLCDDITECEIPHITMHNAAVLDIAKVENSDEEESDEDEVADGEPHSQSYLMIL